MTLVSESSKGSGPRTLTLSVIIPTRNREKKLGRTLQALSLQSLPPDCFEVIVVNNQSNDGTVKIAQEYVRRFARWKLISETTMGAAAARNRGIEASQGQILVFLDDDVVPDASLLAEHLATHRQHEGVAVLGLVRFPWKGQESGLLWWLAWRPELLQSFRFTDSSNVPFLHFYTCNLSLPRRLLMTPFQFDESFHGYGFEDIDFGYRLIRSGHRIVFNPQASALHDFRVPYSEFVQRQYRAGQSLHLFLGKHPELHRLFLSRETSWRRTISPSIGLFTRSLAPCFDRSLSPRVQFLLPLLGRLCGFSLDYYFWKGFRDASRLHPVAGASP